MENKFIFIKKIPGTVRPEFDQTFIVCKIVRLFSYLEWFNLFPVESILYWRVGRRGKNDNTNGTHFHIFCNAI